MAHIAYGLGHCSPGHITACSPGRLPLEAGGAQAEAGPVALGLPLPAVALVGMGRRKGPCTFCMQFVIYFEPQSIDFEGLTPLANENLRALVR